MPTSSPPPARQGSTAPDLAELWPPPRAATSHQAALLWPVTPSEPQARAQRPCRLGRLNWWSLRLGVWIRLAWTALRAHPLRRRSRCTRSGLSARRRSGVAPRRHSSQRGQSLVEFALTVPVLLLVVFGLIEVCLLSTSANALDVAAREAARAGTIAGPAAGADSAIRSAISQATGNGATLLFSHLHLIEVFRSDQNGTVPPPLVGCTQRPGEDVYDGQGTPCPGTLGWPPSARSATFAAADYLGVRLTWSYGWATTFLAAGAGSLQLQAVSVQLIEPETL